MPRASHIIGYRSSECGTYPKRSALSHHPAASQGRFGYSNLTFLPVDLYGDNVRQQTLISVGLVLASTPRDRVVAGCPAAGHLEKGRWGDSEVAIACEGIVRSREPFGSNFL